MRYVKLIVGILLVAKGVTDCIRLPAALAAADTHGAPLAGHASSGFFAGETAGRALGAQAGLVVGAVVVLIGGVLLVAAAWRGRQGTVASSVAS